MKTIFTACAVLFTIALLIGCGGTAPTATLELSFNSFMLKNILPDESMDIASIDIHGDGPDVSTFDVTSDGSAVSVTELLPGEWTISAIAKNDVGTQIAAGSSVATLEIGVSTPVTIALTEDVGMGTLDFTASYEPDVVADPFMVGSIIPANGDPTIDISADLQANLLSLSTSYNGLLSAPSWQTLTFLVYDGDPDTSGVLTGGFATAVRIAEGITSTGSVHLYVSRATGAFVLDFTVDMFDPIALTTTDPEGPIDVFGTHTFTADAGTPGVYVWYVQGTAMGTGQTFDIDATLYDLGTPVNVDVVFFSSDSKHGGSAHWQATPVDSAPTYEFTGTFAYTAGKSFTVTVYDLGMVAMGSTTGTTTGSPQTYDPIGPNAAGDYYLEAWIDENASGTRDSGDLVAWRTSGDPTTTPTEAFSLPHADGVTFNFGNLAIYPTLILP